MARSDTDLKTLVDLVPHFVYEVRSAPADAPQLFSYVNAAAPDFGVVPEPAARPAHAPGPRVHP